MDTTHMPTHHIMIPVAPGELIDRITILQIKLDRITDSEQSVNVAHELELLSAAHTQHVPQTRVEELTVQLKAVNEQLWDIEDNIRECERLQDFGDRFIQLARSVYITNDRRSELKREINVLLGSDLIEEKSYEKY